MVCHLVMEVFVLMRGHYLFASGIENTEKLSWELQMIYSYMTRFIYNQNNNTFSD